jgi:hypothetical protein
MSRRRRQQPEAAIQRAIVQHYHARAADGVFMFAVPNNPAATTSPPFMPASLRMQRS